MTSTAATPTPEIVIIAAIARNGAIGVDGDMVYHLRDDLRRFKQLTMGAPLVMGRRTFESLPSGALPGRRNIVVTRNSAFTAPGVETASSLEEALSMAASASPEKIFILGGAQIYSAAMPLASTLELTLVDDTPPRADTFFPDVEPSQWATAEASAPLTDARSGLCFTFVTLARTSTPTPPSSPIKP